MRQIPVDTYRLNLIGTGKVAGKQQYAQLSDGSSRRTGNQAINDDGIPLWVVDCLIDDDDASRAEVVGVTVAALDEPQVTKVQADHVPLGDGDRLSRPDDRPGQD